MEPQQEQTPFDPASNPFVRDPFQPLRIDPSRYTHDEVYRTYQDISNAWSYFMQMGLLNRKKIIALGPKPKQSEEYDSINSEKYDYEYKAEVLKKKMDNVEQLFNNKRAEQRRSILG